MSDLHMPFDARSVPTVCIHTVHARSRMQRGTTAHRQCRCQPALQLTCATKARHPVLHLYSGCA
eukprot:354352-Chlamydomonas_euryale.AAC.4